MPKKFLPLIVTFSLLALVACKDTPPAGGVAPAKITAEEAEANRQRLEAQRQLEAQRVADEQFRQKRAEEDRLAKEADKAALAKAALGIAPAGLKEPVAFKAEAAIQLPDSGKKVLAHLRANQEVPNDLLTQAFLDLHFAQRQPATNLA